MVPEDLLFWVDTFHRADAHDAGVLCRRHADAMVVPRGWTLDDRREPQPRLFRSPADASGSMVRPRRRRANGSASIVRDRVEQLELEAAEIQAGPVTAGPDGPDGDGAALPWAPVFDADDDLDGLLHVDSPLLARAFRGTGRAR